MTGIPILAASAALVARDGAVVTDACGLGRVDLPYRRIHGILGGFLVGEEHQAIWGGCLYGKRRTGPKPTRELSNDLLAGLLNSGGTGTIPHLALPEARGK